MQLDTISAYCCAYFIPTKIKLKIKLNTAPGDLWDLQLILLHPTACTGMQAHAYLHIFIIIIDKWSMQEVIHSKETKQNCAKKCKLEQTCIHALP